MKINNPCIITSRLLAGVMIEDTECSIDYNGETREGRLEDTPDAINEKE